MLQNTEAGSGHMLGQLRPGQYHVTLVPALPILQHWAPDFLTALQPPASLPGEHTTNHHHILTLHPSPGQRSRERPRLPARALAAKSEPAAASLLGPRQVPGVAGVSRRPCWGGARPGEAAGAGGCRRRWQVQVAGGGAALARPGPGLSEVWARPRSASLRTAAAHQPGLAWPPAWSRLRHHEGEM